MCKERWRTRDLLLEYDKNIMPPRPRAAGLGMIYPWTDNLIIRDSLYQWAVANGYTGTLNEFLSTFISMLQARDKQIVVDRFNNFPEIGSHDYFYFDTNESILYFWDEDGYTPIAAQLIPYIQLHGGDANAY